MIMFPAATQMVESVQTIDAGDSLVRITLTHFSVVTLYTEMVPSTDAHHTCDPEESSIRLRTTSVWMMNSDEHG